MDAVLPQHEHTDTTTNTMGNTGSSGGVNPRTQPPPRPLLDGRGHGVPPPYYHRYPPCPPGAGAPPPVPVPAQVELHRAVTVPAGVTIRGDTLRLEPDEDGRRQLLAFTFDADAPGSITVYFFAQEDDEFVLKATKENLLQPVTVTFKEGQSQEFKQPSGTGIDVSLFEESELIKVGEGAVFPIAFKVEMDMLSSSQELERGPDAEESKSIVRFAIFVKKDNSEYGVRVVKKILWVNGNRYVLEEIYGIANTADRNVHEDSGNECVICLSEPRDTTVLPCRHMCLCRECAQLLTSQTNKCPICRQPVERLLEIEVESKHMAHQQDQQ